MGLPPDRCDAIMARMVYHMIDVAVARDVYLPQISRALRRNGRLLITDHGPTDACVTTRKGAALGGMPVVPLLQEVREFTAAGLALVQTMDWPYMENGFGLLWVEAPKATADLRQANLAEEHTHGWLPAASVRWLTVVVTRARIMVWVQVRVRVRVRVG